MSDIVEFLLARIAEDEAVAVAAEPHEEWISVGKIEDGGMDTADGEHVARWSPARILAECEAKRRIVELHSGNAEWCGWTQGGDGVHAEWEDEYPCDTLLALTQPYADHPDFDPAWRLE